MPATEHGRPPPWRNVRVLAWAFQFAVLGVVVAFIAWLVNNVRKNSSDQGIPTGFEFLDQPSGFTIPGNELRESQPVSDAVWQGLLNTLRVIVVGIVLATILGVLIGIARLSGNWIVRNLAQLYVEVIRNIPLLAIVAFSYIALVLSALPPPADSWEFFDLSVINVRGVVVPWITGRGWLLVLLLVVAAGAAWGVARWRSSVADRTGGTAYGGLWALAVFVPIALGGGALAGIGVTTPVVDGRRVTGGITLQPEYFALLFALVIYTASHIAEIVRGSIQAVDRGQGEAANALALSGYQRMRFVILPQAMRIALPAVGNQYLNLAKNSSLGFVISYFDLTKVISTSIGNRSPAVPAYLLLMVIYLVLSLTISAMVNLANRRLQLAES